MSGSKTTNEPRDWAKLEGGEARSNYGRVRRMAIGVTSRLLWQLIGHRMLDGKKETREAEVFGTAGVISRPGGRNSEAAVIFGGDGASMPMIVAIRDQQMAAAIAAVLTGGQLATGEVAVGAGVEGDVACLAHWKADGTVEIRHPNGEARSLVTHQTFMRHVHTETGIGSQTLEPMPSLATATPVPGDTGTGPLVGTECIKSH